MEVSVDTGTREGADVRPIPLMTSSRMKSAPYLSHTDFIALK